MSHKQTLIEILAAAEGQFVSGEHLSRQLGVSRTAIWKQMSQLRRLGYELESVPHKGYRVIFAPDRFQAESLLDEVAQRLQSQPTLLSQVHVYDEISSTQTVAHELAATGAAHGTLVIAETQNAGRGRLERAWESARARGIWMSLILRPELPLQWASQLTLMAAVAACRALRMQTGLPLSIKWPNDLLLNGRKVAGMLLETVTEANQVRYVVLGIGINVNQRLQDFSADLASIATSLRIEAGSPFLRQPLLIAFFEQLQPLLDLHVKQGFSVIRDVWRELSCTFDRPVRLQTNRGIIEGIAEDIDEYGALLLRLPSGELVKQYSGDLQLLQVP